MSICSLARAHLVSRSHQQLQLLPQTGVALAKVIACCNETTRQPVGSIKETEREGRERGEKRPQTGDTTDKHVASFGTDQASVPVSMTGAQ